MDITFWGVRAERPCLASSAYGGNTPCISLLAPSGAHVIFDAGSGLARLGETLPEQGEAHIFIARRSLDCWEGLPAFAALRHPGWTVNLYFPEEAEETLRHILRGTLFSFSRRDVRAMLHTRALLPGEAITAGGLTVSAIAPENEEPGAALHYRMTSDNGVLCYTGVPLPAGASLPEKLSGADVTVLSPPVTADAGFAALQARGCALAAEEGGLLLFSRHRPDWTDADLDGLRAALEAQPAPRRTVLVACEGLCLTLPAGDRTWPVGESWFKETLATLAQYKDENVILDQILMKCRELCSAEAGTVYLADGDELVFAFTHNDFLFPANAAGKHAYANVRLPLSTKSITGYVATTRTALNLADVRKRPDGAPYGFDDSFDQKTGYTTVSALTVPIINRSGTLLGVLQLLNSRDRAGRVRPFSPDMESRVNLLAHEAAVILENSRNVLRGIKRLIHIISLHDEAENGPHAERVGAIAAELYQQWAEKQGVDAESIRGYKSRLRLAAMLHDIGKVGVSDMVLKKEGSLSEAESRAMAAHTWLGSALFAPETSDISELARETILHHHQKWDGTGTSGHPDIPPLAGNDIPLAARITSIADVFDCLVVPRGYQSAWSFAEAIDLVARQGGGHFDPELVASFLEIQDVVAAIYRRFP